MPPALPSPRCGELRPCVVAGSPRGATGRKRGGRVASGRIYQHCDRSPQECRNPGQWRQTAGMACSLVPALDRPACGLHPMDWSSAFESCWQRLWACHHPGDVDRPTGRCWSALAFTGRWVRLAACEGTGDPADAEVLVKGCEDDRGGQHHDHGDGHHRTPVGGMLLEEGLHADRESECPG